MIDNYIEQLKKKENQIIFFIPQTENMLVASTNHILDIAKFLYEKKYNVKILIQSESADFITDEYQDIPKILQSDKNLKVTPADFIVVPEIAIEAVKTLRESKVKSKIIVLLQGFDYAFDSLQISEHYFKYGVDTVITTSEWLKTTFQEHMVGVENIKIISPFIPEYFSPSKNQKLPTINIVSRNATNVEKFAKLFYLKYPEYSFVLFKNLSGFDRQTFAQEMKDSILSVWMDIPSSFGTFPLESMASNIPVIGLIPEIMPDWMINEDKNDFEKNGLWLNSILNLVKVTSDFISNWVTNSLNVDTFSKANITTSMYTRENFNNQTIKVFNEIYDEQIKTFNKIKNKNTNLKIQK